MPNLLVLDQFLYYRGAAFENFVFWALPEEFQDLNKLFIVQQQPNLVIFEPILPDKNREQSRQNLFYNILEVNVSRLVLVGSDQKTISRHELFQYGWDLL